MSGIVGCSSVPRKYSLADRFPALQQAQIENDYRAGLSMDKLARRYRTSAGLVRKVLVQRNVPIASRGVPPKNVARDEDIAVKAIMGVDYTTLSDEYGLTRQRIQQIAASCGVYRRKQV